MKITKYNIMDPPYLTRKKRENPINPDYTKVEEKFREALKGRYSLVDFWTLENFRDRVMLLKNIEGTVIIIEDRTNRKAIIISENKEKKRNAKRELEGLFNGNPKLHLRETKY